MLKIAVLWLFLVKSLSKPFDKVKICHNQLFTIKNHFVKLIQKNNVRRFLRCLLTIVRCLFSDLYNLLYQSFR